MKWLMLVLLFLFALYTNAQASKFLVKPDGTGGYPTIQAAINVAASGDSILLADGIFTGPGNRDIHSPFGKLTIIYSVSNDPEACVIDCQFQGSGFSFVTPASGSLLRGITVKNANQTGIVVNGGQMAISSCRVESCQGGGLILMYCQVQLDHCLIQQNSSPVIGGGLYLLSADGQITSCQIIGNESQSGGGLFLESHVDIVMTGCLIADNRANNGAGIFGYDPHSVTLTSCDVVANHGGGIWANSGQWSFDHDIIALNEGYGLWSSSSRPISCTDIWGNLGGDWVGGIVGLLGQAGNICENPLFCHPSQGDYFLDYLSPCIIAACGLIGCLPPACGTIPVEETTWGGIKAKYE